MELLCFVMRLISGKCLHLLCARAIPNSGDSGSARRVWRRPREVRLSEAGGLAPIEQPQRDRGSKLQGFKMPDIRSFDLRFSSKAFAKLFCALA
jgi:hypothetical protein